MSEQKAPSAVPESFPSEFQHMAKWSASRYLAYLDANPALGGLSENPVVHISQTSAPNHFEFRTAYPIKAGVVYSVLHNGVELQNISIVKIIGSRGRARCVLVSDNEGLITARHLRAPHEFKLVSDLRFLVRNLLNFYKCHQLSFNPPPPQPLPELPQELTAPFSEGQRQAYDTVFRSPFSYIHGAPGTGKTNMVLSRCILRYILDNKRVFLLAPTNNALEQMLRGILPTFKSLGLDLHTVYRLGMATEEFAQQFPEVVGDPNTDNLLSDLSDEYDRLKKELDRIRQSNLAFYKERAIQRDYAQTIRSIGEGVIEDLKELKVLEPLCKQAELDFEQFSDTLAEQERQFSLVSQSLQTVQAQYTAANARLAELLRLSGSFWAFFWSKNRKAFVASSIASLTEETTKQSNELHQLRTVSAELSEAISASRRSARTAEQARTRHTNSIQDILSHLHLFTEGESPFFTPALQAILSAGDYSTEPIQAIIETAENDYQLWLNSHQLSDTSVLQHKLENIQDQIKNLKGNARQIQHERALVLAGTVDSSLRELEAKIGKESTLPVSHIFLDEAGYTSIMRGAVAFCLNTPVSYFGDHFQLPPIFPIKPIRSDEQPLCLWALSSVYLHDLQQQGVDYLYKHCMAEQDNFNRPQFDPDAFVSLNKSYRFGQKLAKILDDNIYKSELHGVSARSFNVEVWDAPHFGGSAKWESKAEVSAIVSRRNCYSADTTAILTPYNKQVKLLKDALDKDLEDNILTVHRAQGREWDTVILSVVDANNPFLTTSKTAKGRSVLCTAISRARNRLVLVCDVSAWEQMPQQMITRLLYCSASESTEDDLPF